MKATCLFYILRFSVTSKTVNRYRFLMYCINAVRGFKKETRDGYKRGYREIKRKYHYQEPTCTIVNM